MSPLEVFLLLAGLAVLLGVALWVWAVGRLVDTVTRTPDSHRGNQAFPTTPSPPGVRP